MVPFPKRSLGWKGRQPPPQMRGLYLTRTMSRQFHWWRILEMIGGLRSKNDGLPLRPPGRRGFVIFPRRPAWPLRATQGGSRLFPALACAMPADPVAGLRAALFVCRLDAEPFSQPLDFAFAIEQAEIGPLVFVRGFLLGKAV